MILQQQYVHFTEKPEDFTTIDSENTLEPSYTQFQKNKKHVWQHHVTTISKLPKQEIKSNNWQVHENIKIQQKKSKR